MRVSVRVRARARVRVRVRVRVRLTLALTIGGRRHEGGHRRLVWVQVVHVCGERDEQIDHCLLARSSRDNEWSDGALGHDLVRVRLRVRVRGRGRGRVRLALALALALALSLTLT